MSRIIRTSGLGLALVLGLALLGAPASARAHGPYHHHGGWAYPVYPVYPVYPTYPIYGGGTSVQVGVGPVSVGVGHGALVPPIVAPPLGYPGTSVNVFAGRRPWGF